MVSKSYFIKPWLNTISYAQNIISCFANTLSPFPIFVYIQAEKDQKNKSRYVKKLHLPAFVLYSKLYKVPNITYLYGSPDHTITSFFLPIMIFFLTRGENIVG